MLDKDLKALAELLDTKFKGPFGLRFGLDALIGLVPVAGDTITSLLSFYIVGRCAFKGYPLSVLLRMLLNILVELVIGWIPLLGDVFDLVWKANIKNIKLAEDYELNQHKTKRRSKVTLFLVGALIFLILILLIWLFFYLTYLILSALF